MVELNEKAISYMNKRGYRDMVLDVITYTS